MPRLPDVPRPFVPFLWSLEGMTIKGYIGSEAGRDREFETSPRTARRFPRISEFCRYHEILSTRCLGTGSTMSPDRCLRPTNSFTSFHMPHFLSQTPVAILTQKNSLLHIYTQSFQRDILNLTLNDFQKRKKWAFVISSGDVWRPRDATG